MFILCGNKSEDVIMKARFESLRSLFAMYTEGELVTYVSTRKAAQTLLHTYDFRGAHIQLARQCRKVIRSTIGETMREWDSFHSLSEIREQEDKYVNKHLDDFEECPLPLRRYLKERDLLEELQIGPLDAELVSHHRAHHKNHVLRIFFFFFFQQKIEKSIIKSQNMGIFGIKLKLIVPAMQSYGDILHFYNFYMPLNS